MNSITPPTDLTRRPPRSARTRLGGYVILPRVIDKCRALIAGTIGEYFYACPLDMRFFDFVTIDPDAFKKQVEAGLGDGALLVWVAENAGRKHSDHEIELWSRFQESRVPAGMEARDYLQQAQETAAPLREDISTWFDWLDVDDYASFGGKV
ncbi:MAG: hypothetical protein RIR25_1951 [Verrucomicrobiota bacterium]